MIEYLILFLAGLDIILTHYQFTLDKKCGVFDKRREENWIPRMLIGNNPSPIKSVLHSFINIIIIGGGYIYTSRYSYIAGISYVSCVFGMLAIVNYMHIKNIDRHIKNINNKKFWKQLSKCRGLMQ